MAMVYSRALILTMLTSLEGVRPGTACNEPLSAQTPKACVMRSMLSPIKPMSWSSISPLLTQPFGGYQRTTKTHVVILSLPIKGMHIFKRICNYLHASRISNTNALRQKLSWCKHSNTALTWEQKNRSRSSWKAGKELQITYRNLIISCCLKKRPAIFVFNGG